MRATVVLAALALAATLAPTASSAADIRYVSASNLNCRVAPRANAEIYTKLSRGFIVKVVSRSGSWSQVELDRDQYCWVASNYLSARWVPSEEALRDGPFRR